VNANGLVDTPEAEPNAGHRGQLGAGVREADAEVQSESYFDCFERLDRAANHRQAAFSKIAILFRRFA
jgi:hypothetical protein